PEGELPACGWRRGPSQDSRAWPDELELPRPRPETISPLRSHGPGFLRRLWERWRRDYRHPNHNQLWGHGWRHVGSDTGIGEAHVETAETDGGPASRKCRAEGPAGGAGAPDGKTRPHQGRIIEPPVSLRSSRNGGTSTRHFSILI